MRRSLIAFHFLTIFLLGSFASVGYAAVPSHVRNDFTDFFALTKPRTLGVYCGLYKKRWDAAFIKRKKYELARDRYKDVMRRKKRLPGGRRAALNKQLSTLSKLTRVCIAQGKTRRQSSIAIPTSTPTPKPVLRPIAFSQSRNGVGLQAIPVTLTGDAVAAGILLECVLASVPDDVAVLKVAPCGFVFTPKTHSSAQRTIPFVVRRPDAVESSPAILTLTWDQTGTFLGDSRSLTHYKATLNASEAAYLARWVNLGANLNEIRNIATNSGGLDAVVDYLLSPKSCPEVEQAAVALANSTKYTARWEQTAGPLAGLTYSTSAEQWWSPATAKYYWLYQMRYGCEPLRERLGLMIHNTFVANTQRLHGSFNLEPAISSYLSLVRSRNEVRIIAPFDKLVRASYASPAILSYLNGGSAVNALPNQNLARELLELFVLGPRDPITDRRNYVESDVDEMAWTLRGTRTAWYEPDNTRPQGLCDANAQIVDPNNPTRTVSRYSPALRALCLSVPSTPMPTTRISFDNAAWQPFGPFVEKGKNLFAGTAWQSRTLLKANGLDASQDTLTPHLLYKHPGTSRYLATRLLATFSFTSPTDEMVAEVAKTLTDNRYQFEPALKKVFTSSSMFSTESRSDCVAAPIETFVSFLRALNLPLRRLSYTNDGFGELLGFPNHLNWGNQFAASGQGLFAPDTVYGWAECGKVTGNRIHDGTAWLNLQWWLGRLNGIVTMVNVQQSQNYDWKQLLVGLPARPSPERVVDSLADKLALELLPQERELLTRYLTSVSFGTLRGVGYEFPDPTKARSVSWSALSDADFTALLNLKAPGLLELIFGLKRNHVK